MIAKPLLISQPVTRDGQMPSVELVQVIQGMARTIDVLAAQIEALTARVEDLETP